MGLYDEEIALVVEMLASDGKTVTITRTIPGTPAVSDRPAVAPTRIVATCSGIILPLSTKKILAESLQEGTLLQDSSRLLYLAGGNMQYTVTQGAFTGEFIPDTLDKVVISGRLFTITGNSPLAPDDGPTILHRCFAHT